MAGLFCAQYFVGSFFLKGFQPNFSFASPVNAGHFPTPISDSPSGKKRCHSDDGRSPRKNLPMNARLAGDSSDGAWEMTRHKER